MPIPKHSFRYPMLLIAAITVLAGTVVAEQPPACSADIKAVKVLATVRDKHGKIVNNLSPSEFTLDEDGRPQPIRCFSRETDLPLTLGFLVDTSSSQRPNIDQERTASSSFVGHLLREEKDKTFLIHFDRDVVLLQDLTPSKQKLNAALDKLQAPQFQRSQDNRPGDEDDPGSGTGYPGSRGSGRSQRMSSGTVLYDSIYLGSTELMQKQQGRKVIVVLSDGVDRGSKMTLERAIESAQRADALVYSILYPAHQRNENGGGGWGRGGIGGMGGGPWGGRRGGYPPPESQRERPDGKKIMERIAKETGGRMFEVSNKHTVDQIYQEIQEDLRNQYRLGYTPERPGDTFEYHKVHVGTSQKDLVVQAREGYYPPRQVDEKKDNKSD